MYDRIAAKIASGQTIVIDGGTGTDIQRRGVPMDGDTWCAEANLSHPDIVTAVHHDYIDAGAEVITANTYATSALLFNALGRDDDLLKIDAAAVGLAKKAAADRPVAVAGSMSTMRPMVAGSDRNNLMRAWPEGEARRLFRRKADGLKSAGADLIMMEMMRDGDYAVWATESAVATGLPVWCGISVERGADGQLYGWGRADCHFADFLPKLVAAGPQVITIMHTSPNDTDEALRIARQHWRGPLGAYPESGYFTMPDWQFVDIIPPGELVAKARSWQTIGATIIGGCCGIGPDHIRALSRELNT